MKQLHKYAIRWALLGALCFFINLNSFSQKILRSKGFARVKIESHISEEGTIKIAKEKATINAIENAFGIYVESKSALLVENSTSDFRYIGTTKVKGEWLKTIDEDLKIKSSDGERWVEYTIIGKIREIQPKASIEFEILNCPQIECRTTEFYSNEQLYVYVKSPVDGFISIFMDDGQDTWRLLPYSGMKGESQSGLAVEADKSYIFFSEKHNDFPGCPVDEIILYTDSKREYNTVYIVFSETEFVKPVLGPVQTINGTIYPKSLETYKFEQWLVDCRASIGSFLELKKEIVIINKNK